MTNDAWQIYHFFYLSSHHTIECFYHPNIDYSNKNYPNIQIDYPNTNYRNNNYANVQLFKRYLSKYKLFKCGLLKYEKYKIKYIKYKNCSNMNESSKMDKT